MERSRFSNEGSADATMKFEVVMLVVLVGGRRVSDTTRIVSSILSLAYRENRYLISEL